MHNKPIPADLTLFVDGSCLRDATRNHAGYSIIKLDDDTTFANRKSWSAVFYTVNRAQSFDSGM